MQQSWEAQYALYLNLLQRFHPYCCACITWHTQVSSWRQCHTTNLRTIRQAGTLELLGEKSAVEGFQPFQDRCLVIGIRKSTAGNTVNFIRLKACPKHVVQIEIVKLIRTNQVFCFLGDLAILRRQKFWAYRSTSSNSFSPQVSA